VPRLDAVGSSGPPELVVGVVVVVLETGALAVAEVPAVHAFVLGRPAAVFAALPRQHDAVVVVREHVEHLDA
jgi:hypothetical protein